MSRILFTLVVLTTTALGSTPSLAEAPAPGTPNGGGPRQFGGLVVESPPRARSESARGRLPYDIEGSLVVGDARVWVGPEVPAYVPLGIETAASASRGGKASGVTDTRGSALELVRLEPDADGALALYREMYATMDSPGCPSLAREGTLKWANCLVQARYYDRAGSLRWELDVSGNYPRKDHLQLVDLVKVGDRVYYNEACATYSAEAGGRCANVVAVDVGGAVPKVLWRSKALVSNAPIVPVGAGARWLVTGYGFTDERDFLVLLDAERGTVVQKVLVKKAPESIVLAADGTLEVLIYDAEVPTRFELVGLDGKKPKLRPLK
jgi:hypothetical protein